MTFRIEDNNLDPDLFLSQALQAKIDYLNHKIEELLVSGKHLEEVGKLSVARAKFMEISNSPRLYLAKLPGVESQAAQSAPAVSERKSLVPDGAIPQPKRVGEAQSSHETRSSSQAASYTPKESAPSPKGGMMSFLKSVQTSTTQASSTQPASAQIPAPISSQPSAASSKPKGKMLSFLEKVKAGDTQSEPEEEFVSSNTDNSKIADQMTAMLELRASSKGFKNIYDMLASKRQKLEETMNAVMKSTDQNAVQAAMVIRAEIAEIDVMLKQKPEEIAKKINESVKSQNDGDAEIGKELKGLFEELK